jgi:hypothetical protein
MTTYADKFLPVKRTRRLRGEPRPSTNDVYEIRVSQEVGIKNGMLIQTPLRFERICRNCTASFKQGKCEY